MAEQHTVRVVVEGDTASLNSALSRSSAESSKFTEAVGRSGQAIDKNKDAIGKFGAAAKSAAPNIAQLAAGASASAKSTASLASAAFGAAKAFGPWGLAVGIAGDLLVAYVSSAEEATKRTQLFWKEVRAGIFVAQKSVKDAENLAVFTERDAAAIKQATAEIDGKVIALEDQIAKTDGLGQSTRDLERAVSELRAESLRAQADVTLYLESDAQRLQRRIALLKEAAAIERGQTLADIKGDAAATLPPKTPTSRSAGGRGRREVVQSDEFMAELAASRGPANGPAAIERDDDREFAAELEQAKDAQIAAQIQRDYDSEARAAAAEEAAAKRHEAELARLAARQAAEEKLMARRVALGQMAVGLANSGAQLANMVAKASGASAKKQEAIANRVAGVQAMAIGALEVVQAFAAAASFNVPQAVLHGAAAVVAFAQGGMLLALAGGGGGAASGGGGAVGGALGGAGSTPGGATQAAPGSDSAIPGSPGPQSPKSGSSGSSGGGKSTVINIGEVHTYGTPRREFLASVAEGLDVDHASQRRRTA